MPSGKPFSLKLIGITAEEVERRRVQFESLVALVPRDYSEKLIRAELEEEKADWQEELSIQLTAEEKAELEKLSGKTLENPLKISSDKMTPEEEAEIIKLFTDHLVVDISRSWFNTLNEARHEDKVNILRLDRLLLPSSVFEDKYSAMGLTKMSSWLDLVLLASLVTVDNEEELVKIYEQFAANLKNEVDKLKSNNSAFLLYESGLEILTLESDEQGYFVRIVQKH